MANELYEWLKEFKRENLVSWSKEILFFFKRPRQFVETISNQKTADLIPQYTYYFLVYTFSYVFFSVGFSINELLKPALLSFSTLVPVVFIFSFSAWVATRKNYLKKIFIFIISLNLFSFSSINFTLCPVSQ